MAKLVSKVYGDALFSVAVEEDQVEELRQESAQMIQALTENPEFLTMVCHPEMTQEKKTAIFREVFGEGLSGAMLGLIDVMIRKGRIGELLSVLTYFDGKVREYLKIGVVDVSTPIPLSGEQKQRIESKILQVSGYETLECNYRMDESLLGGVVIRIGDRVLDNSIRSKLETMSRQLYKVRLS